MLSSENAASRKGSVCERPTSKEEEEEEEEEEPWRIVLLGRTGTGRSSSGNSILHRPAFLVDVSPCSVTTHCKKQTGSVGGRSVSIVDTPGFFHTHLSPQEVMEEVGRCVSLSSPGPHVFLVTLQPGRFTQEERETLEWIKARFGPGVMRFTVVLFTCGDQLQGKRVDDFMDESPELSQFIKESQGRYHVFDNTKQDEKKTQQVLQLLEKVGKLVEDNGGGCYSNEMFKEAESIIQDAQERIMGECGNKVESPKKVGEDKVEQRPDLERRKEEEERRKREEEEENRKRAERLFWSELLTAVGKGAAEGAGIMGKDKGKGKAVKKAKVVEKAAALAASPLSINSLKAVGGAMREGGKVLYKHRKTLLK